MYHGSRSANRTSILAHGLRAAWDPDVDDEPAVFMCPRPNAMDDEDVWEIDVNGLNVKRDPWGSFNGTIDEYMAEQGGSWYVAQDIGPERVRLYQGAR
jgi:hypothetical protein